MPRKNDRGGSRSDDSMFSGWSDTARERPLATAAVAAAAVGAGVFLWNRRNQISDQLSNLSDQISDWTENLRSPAEGELEMIGTGSSSSLTAGSARRTSTGTRGTTGGTRTTGSRSTSGTTGRGRTAPAPRSTGISETGGGNASPGAHSGTTGSGADNL